MNILVTGGAGFIGSHLVDQLLADGHSVRVVDNLDPQVHGPYAVRPDYLSRDAEMIVGDVRDADAVRRALKGIDVVYHLAAKVGVGQSAYQPLEYTNVNNLGTATLLQCLIEQPVKKLVVASSMSIYGEGRYVDGIPAPTPETKAPTLASLYALSKYDQEQMCLLMGKAHKIPATALRFFNVYGTRQSLSNPYTGVIAIFASRLLNGKSPVVFEDGLQTRDFVHVSDIARACVLAISESSDYRAINVGTGQSHTVLDVATGLAKVLGLDIQAEVTNKYRTGDIRHCVADTSLAQELLGYSPQVTFANGLAELVQWLRGQRAIDRVQTATDELIRHGLVA